MDSNEKLRLMATTVKPIRDLIKKRMSNKLEALKAYDTNVGITDAEVNKIREIEAVKLRHEVEVLNDLTDIIDAMYPNA